MFQNFLIILCFKLYQKNNKTDIFIILVNRKLSQQYEQNLSITRV